ncbi:hypothetical protein HK101_006240 [Irineochytrium annulatum]|nr:hypothetical protein HK101_006240 [Irineochytrium annulatum]
MRSLATAFVAAATLLAGIPDALANPFLNTPNSNHLNGSLCQPPVRKNVVCEVICTSDYKKFCPPRVMPVCPAEQTWCADGTCKPNCDGVTPLCSCRNGYFPGGQEDGATPFMPCSTAPILVDVPNYLQDSGPKQGSAIGNAPLRAACAAAINNFVISNTSADTKLFFNECAQPQPSRNVTTAFAPEFVTAYLILAFEGFLLTLHFLYKKFAERNFREGASMAGLKPSHVRGVGGGSASGSPSHSKGAPFLYPEVEMGDMGAGPDAAAKLAMANLTFKGYRNDPIGATTGATVTVTSFVWLILMAVLVLDYYAVFAGFGFREESDMVFYDHDLLSSVFILVWHIVTIWFVVLKLGQATASAYYGVRVPLSHAAFVIVEKKEEKAVHMANMGKIVEWVWKVEAVIKRVFKMDVSVEVTPVLYTTNGRRYIEFECVRYVYNDREGTFEPYVYTVGPSFADLHKQSAGLISSDANDRIELVGPNAIAFPADTFYTAMGKEFSGVFYVYQMMFLWICYYAYYYMGLVLTTVIIVSGIVKVFVYVKAQQRVLSMANFTGTIRVLRNGNWVVLSTYDVVPGDVIEIEASDHVLPVDAVLVDGGAVCDESSLTGEALPVVKFPVRNDPDVFFRADETSKNHSLYAGCFILQTQPTKKNSPVLAIVTSTGAMTTKGRLVKDILYPSSVSFVFTEHLKVVFPMLILWGIVMLALSIGMIGTQGVDSWFYGMFTISQVLSPLLPAVLVIGQSVASERLAKKGIMCVDLDRITLSGKVKVFCFDKTGTLTKEGLNFLGVQSVNRVGGPSAFGKVQQDFSTFPEHLRRAMLTCHSVTSVGKQLVGNFVDVEMFRATGATLSTNPDSTGGDGTMVYPITNGDRNLLIVKRFEFVHSHAYMSTLVKDPVDNKLHVYMKGSFERLKDLSDPSSVPADYDSIARFHASEGCYVLAFARRELPAHISVEDAIRMQRSELEAGCQLAGLVLFRNELKHDTGEALEELRDGGCRVVMITGDNADTACFIAKASGMIRAPDFAEAPVIVRGDVNEAKTQVVWSNAENGAAVSDQTLNVLLDTSRRGGRAVELAVTGKAFNMLLKAGKMREMLFETRIFARMSPEDKVNCVKLHMEKAVTAMCGDGGNDAGALKAAHAGIALSEAESSVVSHFSSRNRSVMSCVELLKEARCSLDVSFASYKYLIMYGEVLSFMGLIQYYFTVNMSQAMWVLIDGSTVPLSWALTMAKPAARLARTRPTARLLGPETIISVVGQVLINIIFLISAVVLLFKQDFFRCNEFNGQYADVRRWWELGDNYEGAITGMIGTFQIINAAAVYNIGHTYRSGFFRNYIFLGIWVVMAGILSFVILGDPNSLGCLFHVNCGTPAALDDLNVETGTKYSTNFLGIPDVFHSASGHNVMPSYFRWQLWFLVVGNFAALILFEWVVVLGVGRRWAKKTFPLKRLSYRTAFLLKGGHDMDCVTWRMNLLECSRRDPSLLFIACLNHIRVYRLPHVPHAVKSGPHKKLRYLIPHDYDPDDEDAEDVPINAIRVGSIMGEEVLVSVDDRGVVRIYFTQDLDRQPIVRNNGVSTWCSATFANLLAVSSNAHVVKIYDLGADADCNGTRMATGSGDDDDAPLVLEGHQHNIPSIDFSRCGRLLASASIDWSVMIWSVETGQAVRTIRPEHLGGRPPGNWGVRFIPREAVREKRVPLLWRDLAKCTDGCEVESADGFPDEASDGEDEGMSDPEIVLITEEKGSQLMVDAAEVSNKPAASLPEDTASDSMELPKEFMAFQRKTPTVGPPLELYYLVVTTARNVLLIDPDSGETLDRHDDVLALFQANLQPYDRMSFIHYVPNLGIFIAASQAGQVGLSKRHYS